MATAHAFFYPFPLAHCKVNETDPATQVASITNYPAQMLRDPKSVVAFTIDACLTNPTRIGNKINWSESSGSLKYYAQQLVAMSDKTTLYVCGHSGSGLDTISSPDEKVDVKSAELASYLELLPCDWPGRIKCFGCESANTKGLWMWASQSFAKRLFDVLHKSHPRVEVYGYTHSIATWPTTDPKTGQSHKYVEGVRTKTYLQRVQ